MRIVDIHMHAFPGVDDGAVDMNMAIDMLRIAEKEGISDVILVFHSWQCRYSLSKIQGIYQELKIKIHSMDMKIRIYMGCEFAWDAQEFLETNPSFVTLNNTNFLLVEYSPWMKCDDSEVIKSIKLVIQKGYVPVIAHAERYPYTNTESVTKWKEKGAFIQMNICSIWEETKTEIKERARCLLENKLVDFVGSDAHQTKHRPPCVRSGMKYMYDNYEREYIDQILSVNAIRLLKLNE